MAISKGAITSVWFTLEVTYFYLCTYHIYLIFHLSEIKYKGEIDPQKFGFQVKKHTNGHLDIWIERSNTNITLICSED